MGFALYFKVQLLIIVLDVKILAIAFCRLATSDSMWWKCIFVIANILGHSLLGHGIRDLCINGHRQLSVRVRKLEYRRWQLIWG